MKVNMKKIYLILVNYNRQKLTEECLDSLLKIKKIGFELHTVVVDNDPLNRSDINEKKYSQINLKVIFSPTNSGFSGGMNLGIKEALKNGADYVLIHNNDTFVKEDFLKELFEFAEKNENAGIVAPKIYFAKGFEFHKDKYKENELGKVFWYAGGKIDWANVVGSHMGVDEVDHGQYDEIMETETASGCCMLINTKLLDEIGMFDEKYFLYYEDADLCLRAKRAGFKIYYFPAAVIWHKNAGSTGGSGSKLQDYYITRNRLLFGSKYAPIRSRIALIREGIKLTLNGRDWQKKGAKDYFLHRFGKSKYF